MYKRFFQEEFLDGELVPMKNHKYFYLLIEICSKNENYDKFSKLNNTHITENEVNINLYF